MSKKLILGASVGNCVHVAGVAHFLSLAEDAGYETHFAGPAVKAEAVVELVKKMRPDVVALGYRLTPENVVPIVQRLQQGAQALEKQPVWVFGGTGPVAAVVRQLGFFDTVFDGAEDLDDCIAWLRGQSRGEAKREYAQSFTARLAQKRPYPLLRHHFGLPGFEATRSGIGQIAKAGVLDVVSLGIDQNTQQFFFRPEARDPAMDGAGGVPVRTAEEFRALKAAAQQGNHPLVRCYSGTADVLRLAEVLADTIDNAWCAVPLFWYNELDGRGTRRLEDSMAEAQQLVAWHAQKGIPVELNEPHHWGLRDAHDTISVAASFLCAYQAKKLGVGDYIAQYMFNVPGAMGFAMDLAKVLAQIELTEGLKAPGFNCYRETRAGLPFLSGDLEVAKGQLAASTMLQMAVDPDVIHVVGYSEAEHAATPQVVIESTKIVRGVIRSCLLGGPDPAADEVVQLRRRRLVSEARWLLEFIRSAYADVSNDPWMDPAVLADCVRRGILDAPHIVKNERYRGILQTRMIDGCCQAYDPATCKPLSEEERLGQLAKAGLLEERWLTHLSMA